MVSKGVVLQGERRAEIVAEEVSAPVGRQVLIRTHAVGLCGSDIGLYHGTYAGPRNYPLYFGHEWSGTVEAVGPDVTKVKSGDKVTGDCSIYCSKCEFCAPDRDKNLCQRIEGLNKPDQKSAKTAEVLKAADLLVKANEDVLKKINEALREKVSQCERTEKSLEKATLEWERTFDAIKDLIFIQDADFTILKANKAFLDAMGLRSEDVIGKKCYEIMHKTDEPWPTCPFECTKKDNKTYYVKTIFNIFWIDFRCYCRSRNYWRGN